MTNLDLRTSLSFLLEYPLNISFFLYIYKHNKTGISSNNQNQKKKGNRFHLATLILTALIGWVQLIFIPIPAKLPPNQRRENNNIPRMGYRRSATWGQVFRTRWWWITKLEWKCLCVRFLRKRAARFKSNTCFSEFSNVACSIRRR